MEVEQEQLEEKFADPSNLKGETTLEVDGEVIRFKFDYNAVAELEERHGIDLLDFQEKFAGDEVSLSLIRKLAWAGMLRQQGDNWTTADAGDCIDDILEAGKFQSFVEALTEALVAFSYKFGEGVEDSELEVKDGDTKNN